MRKFKILICVGLYCALTFVNVGCKVETKGAEDITQSSLDHRINSQIDGNRDTEVSQSVENNYGVNATQNDVISRENKAVIASDEARSIVEVYCKKPNVGVQVFHQEQLDIAVNGIKYYYFDIVYGLLMGDKPEVDDTTLTRVFVNSQEKTLHEVVEGDDGELSIGELIQ